MRAACIIGAGPVGLHTAKCLQTQGFDAAVIEEHTEVGRPVQCAGLVSRSGIEALKLDFGSAIVNEIRGARMFSPGGEQLIVKRADTVAYVIDREKFDRQLHRAALASGAEVMLNAKVLDVRGETVFVHHNNRGEMVKARVVVGADGAASRVREIFGMELPAGNFVNSYQARVRGSFDGDLVELHFGSGFAPKFFAWVIPESRSVARVGVGASGKNAKDCLWEFLQKRGIPATGCFDEAAGIIPVGPPLSGVCRENVLLVGDAAFHTKATSGGGLMIGLQAAEVCADTVVEYYKNKRPLADYEKNLGKLNRELETHWKVRTYLNGLSDRQIDEFFVKLRDAGIEEFLEKEGDMDKPGRFLGKLMLRPKMWGLLKEVVGLLKR